jgi:hypothetical protein
MKAGFYRGVVMYALAVGACSPSAMIDKMASDGDKKLAFKLTDLICNGDSATLQPLFAPELWEKSGEIFSQAKPYCPEGPGSKRLVGYQWNTNKTTSSSSSAKNMVVVTQSAGKWTTTVFELQSVDGAPERVVSWNINASREKPADLAALDAMDAAVPMIRAIGSVVLLLIAGGIFWAIRRSRARRAQR